MPDKTSSPFDGVEVEHDVMIVMRDGVRLATDIYRPVGRAGPFPVLLERTPYGKQQTNHADRSAADPIPKSKPVIAAIFARAGYVYVLQDCRGRFKSEGDFTKYISEGPDGVDTITWLIRREWCDGSIGTLGLSYSAHAQVALAAFQPAGLKAMFLDCGGFSSAYHSGIRQGGAFELKQLTWAIKHARLSPKTAADSGRKAALDAIDVSHWLRVNPWRKGHSPLAAAPEYEDYILEQWSQECFSEFWRQNGLYAADDYSKLANIPIVHMSGWYDPYARTAVENYRETADINPKAARLILGPWTHGQRSVSYAGNVDFGPAAPLDGNIAPDYVLLRLAWFDTHLRGKQAPSFLHSPVKIFVMGGGTGRRTAMGRLDHGGKWRDEVSWPLLGTVMMPLYLNDSAGLSYKSSEIDTSLVWTHNPANPVPTIGGAVTSAAPLMKAGGFDQREGPSKLLVTVPGRALADRNDVLSFQTDPLSNDVEVTGTISAKLWVSSSAQDTDVMIKLIDVYPPTDDYPLGYSLNLTHGILRLKFRESFEKAVPLVPSKIYEVIIESFPISNLFAKGHCIRLDVASSNFPHFDVNQNTLVQGGEASAPVIAMNRIYMAPTMPSHILLPIIAPKEHVVADI